MKDACVVSFLQSFGDLTGDIEKLSRVQRTPMKDLFERRASHQLHGDERQVF